MMRFLTAFVCCLSFPACSADDARDDAHATDTDVTPDAPDAAETEDASDALDGRGETDDVETPDAAETTSDIPRPDPDGWLTALQSPEDWAALSKEGGEVKYLARVAGKAPPAPLYEECYFQDMKRWEFHHLFLRTFPGLEDLPYEAYLAMVLNRPSRVLWGGAVRPYPAVPHPRTKVPGIVVYNVYSQDVPGSLTAADLIELDATLEHCIPFAADLLVLAPEPISAQLQLTIQQRDVLEAGDVDVIDRAALRDDPLRAEVYVKGEGYGTLLVVAEGEVVRDYGPRDIVIATAAPNDISLVAGLVTREIQNVHSHVNLRLAEKQIPSASVADIYQNALVKAYDGKLIHLVVDDHGVTIEPATLEAAEAFWEAHRPVIPDPIADLDERALADFATLRASDAPAFGVKAANLGELYQILPAEHRVTGFGIPFSYYRDFVVGSPLGARIETMLADPRMVSDAVYARATLDALREAFEDTPLPAATLDAVAARIREVLGEGADTLRVRFRSSTNAEDLDVISGAGLYDSKSGCLADDFDGDFAGPSRCLGADERTWMEAELARRQAELAAHPERWWLPAIIDDLSGDLTKEKPVARALRKVWASLWNERAFEERAYYGIAHEKVFMGVAVAAAFVMEPVNSVAVTNLPAATGGPLYRIVSQVDGISVVRPEDPLAVAEVLTFHRAGAARVDTDVLVASSLLPPGGQVYTEAELDTLSELLFLIHDHFALNVYPDISPLSLDLEIKRTALGEIVVKQVRPYLGSALDPSGGL